MNLSTEQTEEIRKEYTFYQIVKQTQMYRFDLTDSEFADAIKTIEEKGDTDEIFVTYEAFRDSEAEIDLWENLYPEDLQGEATVTVVNQEGEEIWNNGTMEIDRQFLKMS